MNPFSKIASVATLLATGFVSIGATAGLPARFGEVPAAAERRTRSTKSGNKHRTSFEHKKVRRKIAARSRRINRRIAAAHK